MTDADSFRENFGRENGTHVMLTPLITKAVADALEDFPVLS